ncbi:pentapeptide repeat-containing protein [Phascolarctobacterium faecium]|uniref:pentapeptide repeat-containing protein n=1 Tax=Phascolarctobacterium faecium TaxID=33025 RepID=UPI0032BF3F23
MKRKMKNKIRRKRRLAMGKKVPFDLANCSKKFNGFNNKYCLHTNIHNLIYKDGSFENIKYQASNITYCNFKNTKLMGVEFFHSNLKNTSFKQAKMENVIFFNCNLKNVDFSNAILKNVFFIATNIDNAIGISGGEFYLIKSYPDFTVETEVSEILGQLSNINEYTKYKILFVTKKKINKWMLKLLMEEFGTDLNRALRSLISRKDKRKFFTLYSYRKHIANYLKV